MLMQKHFEVSEELTRTSVSSNPMGSALPDDERWAVLDEDPFVLTQIAVTTWLAATVATVRMVEAHRRIWTKSFG